MIKKILLFLVLTLSVRAQSYSELREYIVAAEGYSNKCYQLDGYWHIGIGHLIPEWSPNWSDYRIEYEFGNDLSIACHIALSEISNFSRQPKEIRLMLVAMAFNLGPKGFHDFHKFRKAIVSMDYNEAANQIDNSLWAKQLTSRTNKYIKILRKYAKK